MKKIMTVGLLLIATNLYAQDNSNVKSRKLSPADVKKYGKFITVVVDGKNTIIRNPNYDPSKFLKRDTSRRFDNAIIEIYTSNSTKPIIKKELISDLIFESSEHLKNGVITVYLKPGVVALSIPDLLDKFNINKENKALPLYIDFRPVAKQDEVLAVPQSVYKIEAVKDYDGFQFLNIVSQASEANRKKYGDNLIYIR